MVEFKEYGGEDEMENANPEEGLGEERANLLREELDSVMANPDNGQLLEEIAALVEEHYE